MGWKGGPGPATGSSLTDAFNGLFSDTSIIAGEAVMLVVTTGGATRFGAISASMQTREPPTSFERGVHAPGMLILRLTGFLVLFVLLTQLIRHGLSLDSFLFAVAFAVGLTPELLPMIMTVTLARGAERMARRIDLFVRVSPEQKSRIVHALRRRGHTVGFIGDGINNAPAIHAADVGLSVEGGTNVRREAAAIIIVLTPDLGVLADGVAEGRRTHANIMKYVRMGTSSNFGTMLSMALASLVLPLLPLASLQILINNLIYDVSEIGIPFDRADEETLAAAEGLKRPAMQSGRKTFSPAGGVSSRSVAH